MWLPARVAASASTTPTILTAQSIFQSGARDLNSFQELKVAIVRPVEKHMRFAALTSLQILLLFGCATTVPRRGEAPITTEWRKLDFHVRFQAGPRGQEGRSYSFYEITQASAGQQERSIVMESAHSLGGFNGDPRDWIRIVQDPNGRALLIEEEIPNDCGPCSNYLWIHLASNGSIEGKYLLLPSNVTGPPGGIDDEYPNVKFIDGDNLGYAYSTGDAATKRISEIDKSDRPTPPG